jgi:predicted nucleic acid-binding protein
MIRFLFDTSVLVYAFDAQAEEAKRDRATQILGEVIARRQASVSAQNLAEFAQIALRKLRPPMPPAQLTQEIERFSQLLVVFDLTPAIVLEALRGVRDYQLAYYDAQIWAAARLNQIPLLLSEDFSTGTSLEGVRFLNPFAPDFRLEAWL